MKNGFSVLLITFSSVIKQKVKQFSYTTLGDFAVHQRELEVDFDVGEKVVRRVFMSLAVHERRVGVHRYQLLLVDVGEARVVRDQIGILFIVDSLDFPSRLDARASRLELWT